MPPLGSPGDTSSDDGFEGGPAAPIAPATQQQPVMMDTSLFPSLMLRTILISVQILLNHLSEITDPLLCAACTTDPCFEQNAEATLLWYLWDSPLTPLCLVPFGLMYKTTYTTIH